ncbi:hypothetical protein DVH24_009959 [Malus domestica]|uniref:Uncharacterized protein n=1 Tax=Malus domestica TaxID=3750 RepID=A0A498JV05_MALDO|nr:hypothetical protein DVH24_009959 [Malus domestica]
MIKSNDKKNPTAKVLIQELERVLAVLFHPHHIPCSDLHAPITHWISDPLSSLTSLPVINMSDSHRGQVFRGLHHNMGVRERELDSLSTFSVWSLVSSEDGGGNLSKFVWISRYILGCSALFAWTSVLFHPHWIPCSDLHAPITHWKSNPLSSLTSLPTTDMSDSHRGQVFRGVHHNMGILHNPLASLSIYKVLCLDIFAGVREGDLNSLSTFSVWSLVSSEDGGGNLVYAG